MVCAISCMISTMFVVGMIYFYNMTNKSEIVKQYKNSLPSDLQKRYENISDERKRISIYGYILGLILSLFVVFYNIKIKGQRLNTFSLVCIVMATCFVTNYFYYKYNNMEILKSTKDKFIENANIKHNFNFDPLR